EACAESPDLERGARPPALAQTEEVAAQLALEVVVEGALAAVAKQHADEAGPAFEDGRHLFDHGAFAPLLVVGMEDPVAATQIQTPRHPRTLTGRDSESRPAPRGDLDPARLDDHRDHPSAVCHLEQLRDRLGMLGDVDLPVGHAAPCELLALRVAPCAPGF